MPDLFSWFSLSSVNSNRKHILFLVAQISQSSSFFLPTFLMNCSYSLTQRFSFFKKRNSSSPNEALLSLSSPLSLSSEKIKCGSKVTAQASLTPHLLLVLHAVLFHVMPLTRQSFSGVLLGMDSWCPQCRRLVNRVRICVSYSWTIQRFFVTKNSDGLSCLQKPSSTAAS